MPKYARPTAYAGRGGNSSVRGQVRFATLAEAEAGTSEELAISPYTLDQAVDILIPDASTTTKGIIEIATDAEAIAGTSTTLAMTPHTVGLIAIAGAPDASETVKGIAEIATTAEAQAGTDDARIMTAAKVVDLLETPPAIGGTTPGAGSFSTLGATGAVDFDAGGSWESGGATIDIAADASADAVNLGTGAAARTVTIGNVTGATAVAINSGTGHITLTSTGAGDIIINSDDTCLIDSDGVLELNSSAGVISIGNDDVDQNINLGSDGERVITIGSNNGAAQVDLEAGSGGINLGTAASAQSISIGNNTGATAVVIEVGTGNFAVDGVGASTYTIGADTTTGTVAIGGTSQTGTMTLSPSDGAQTVNIANADGAKTINVGAGVDGNTISLGNGANTSAQIINVAGGASAANSTVNILSGNGSAGTQTLNALSGNRAGALNLGTGAAAHVIAIGSSSAGAITVDTAANISLDSATASNFTVTGAADLTLDSSAGSVNIDGGEADAAAISIQASNAAGGIDCDSGTAGTAIDSTGAVSIDAAAASNFTVTGAGIDLTLDSAAGRVIVNGEEAAANAITLLSAAGGIDADAALQINIASSQNAGDAIRLNASAGGIDIDAAGAAGEDITVDNAAGSVNITSGEAVSDAIVLSTSNAAGGIDMAVGTGGVEISGTGSFLSLATAASMVKIKEGAVTDSIGSATLINGTIAVANTNIATGDLIVCWHIAPNGSTALGVLTYTISNGASFTINSLDVASPGSLETGDDSDVGYFIIRPL